MRHRIPIIICSIAALSAVIFWRPSSNVPHTAQLGEAKHQAGADAQPATPPEPTAATPELIEPAPASDAPPARTDANNPFRVDSTGQLVLDEQTRLNIEALFAQTDRADLPEAQQNVIAKLPPAAASEAAALLERYDNYSKAQRQAYPPGIAPATEESALAELDGLHALRVAHFGADTAKALYSHEEATTRSLIDLMRLEKDQSLTLSEKAERAQQLHDDIAARQPDRPR